MSAAGKVATGFSKPYVAIYSANGNTVSYASGQQLARGVKVSIEPKSGDDKIFYADNVAAETAKGKFTGGEAKLTVDGLLNEAEALILGLPTPDTITVDSKSVKVYKYGDATNPPYVGIGFVVRYQSDGVDSFAPCLLTKTRFQLPKDEAATQEDSISYQTRELTATLMRDDSATHDWKHLAEDQTTEAEAEAVLKAMLGIAAE